MTLTLTSYADLNNARLPSISLGLSMPDGASATGVWCAQSSRAGSPPPRSSAGSCARGPAAAWLSGSSGLPP